MIIESNQFQLLQYAFLYLGCIDLSLLLILLVYKGMQKLKGQ